MCGSVRVVGGPPLAREAIPARVCGGVSGALRAKGDEVPVGVAVRCRGLSARSRHAKRPTRRLSAAVVSLDTNRIVTLIMSHCGD